MADSPSNDGSLLSTSAVAAGATPSVSPSPAAPVPVATAPAANQAQVRPGDSAPATFRDVLQSELNLLNSTSDSALAEHDEMETLFKAALKRKLIGLAFSGGGIRSATFNLGVLQGLSDCVPLSQTQPQPPGNAKHDLLKSLSYLSSVSGGGYIASWFAAWVLRAGSLENVATQLRSNRIEQARADRGKNGSHKVFDAEPTPINHLREYSNYLTPRVGSLSADSWTLIAIYLRNLLAIQMILVPLTLSLIFAVLLVTWGFVNHVNAADAWIWMACGIVP